MAKKMRDMGHHVLGLIYLLASPITPFPVPNLNGVWSCNDGGTYYIRQVDNFIWWYGENSRDSPSFTNVAHGTIAADIIQLSWVDVPKGQTFSDGDLTLFVQSDRKLTATREHGGFAGSVWTR